LLVTPYDFAVLVVLVVPTKHAQDCGACSQGSQAELYVCYHVRMKIKIRFRLSHGLAVEVGLHRWNREYSALGEHQHGEGVGTHVSFAGFRFL
jgi:hypothetical protein